MISVPLALYIHIPWCVRKCPYCDFNSHEVRSAVDEAAYVRALVDDLTTELDRGIDRDICTIFIGGGTPSLFSPDSIGTLLQEIRKYCHIEADAEITLEANPGTMSEGQNRFRGYRDAGINRVSLGVQSFSDSHLQALGRIHCGEEARLAFEAARAAGISNINIDLMHGLPGQTPDEALADLNTATSLEPEHISWYQLTIEPNTVFYKRPPVLPADDVLWEIYEQGSRQLAGAGFERYEVSAFARAGCRSRHNLNYWTFGDYIGIGAGAHGKLSLPGGIIRTTKTRRPEDYLASPGTRTQPVATDELPLEFLMNALRLAGGFDLAAFTLATGLPSGTLDSFLASGVKRGLLDADGSHVRPTALGMQYLNDLLMLVETPGIITRS
ncbi:MAG: radical SAM family heme chaperone HemW [Pseudomonadota bacterium]